MVVLDNRTRCWLAILISISLLSFQATTALDVEQGLAVGERNSQRLASFPRRMIREVDTQAITISATVFSLLGIALGPFGIVGMVPSVIGVILPLMVSDNSYSSLQHVVQSAIRDERHAGLKATLNGFMNTAQLIANQASQDGRAVSFDKVRNFFFSVHSARFHFMRTSNLGHLALYFNAFAKFHLRLNQLLVDSSPSLSERASWNSVMRNNTRDYVEFANHVVRMTRPMSQFQTDRSALLESMTNWTKLLPPEQQWVSSERYNVHFDEAIAFKNAGEWLSCRGSHGDSCEMWSCLGDDPTITRSSYYVPNVRDESGGTCRRSVFFARAIDDLGDRRELKTCDRVGIYIGIDYRLVYSPHLWLGVQWLFWRRAGSATAGCPLDRADRMRHGRCHWERWQILLVDRGNECGLPIRDRDPVYLSAHDRNGPLAPRHGWQQSFFIHRMTATYDQYFPSSSGHLK